MNVNTRRMMKLNQDVKNNVCCSWEIPEENALVLHSNVQDLVHHNHEEAALPDQFDATTLTPHYSEIDRRSLEHH